MNSELDLSAVQPFSLRGGTAQPDTQAGSAEGQAAIPDVGPEGNAPQTPSGPPKSEPGMFDLGLFKDAAKDLNNAVLGAGSDVITGTIQTGVGIANYFGAGLSDPTKTAEYQKKMHVDEPKSVVSAIARDAVRLGMGYMAGGKLLGGLDTVTKRLGAIALGSTVTSDPHAPNLNNIIQDYPRLQNPVSEFLAAKKDDPILLGKLKHAVEDTFTDAVGEVFLHAIQAYKATAKGDTVGLDAASKKINELLPQAEKEIETGAKKDPKGFSNPAEQEIPLQSSAPASAVEPPAVSVRPDVSTGGTLPAWKTNLVDPRFDLFKAMPGGESRNAIHTVNIDDLKLGHPMDTKPAEESVQKYMKLFQEDPSKIPALVREEMPDGTFTIANGNGRLEAAHRLGIKEIPVVDFRSADTVKARGSWADLDQKTKAALSEGQDLWDKLPQGSKDKIQMDVMGLKPGQTIKLTEGADGQIRAYKTEKAAVQVTNAMGEPMFVLTEDMKKGFDGWVTDHIRNADTETLFEPLSKAFNYANMNSPYEVHQVLDVASNLLRQEVPKLGQVRLLKETERFADMIGENPLLLRNKLARLVGDDVQRLDSYIVAGKSMMQGVAKEILSLANQQRAGILSPKGEMDLLRLQDTLIDIAGLVKTTQTAAARATSAGRIVTKPTYLEQEMKAFMQDGANKEAVKTLVERLSLVQPDELDKAAKIALLSRQSKWSMFTEYYLNALLSGPATSIKNIASGSIEAALSPTASLVGGLVSRDKTEIRRALLTYQGLGKHWGDSWEMMKRSFRREQAILDPGSQATEQMGYSIVASAFDLKEGSTLQKSFDMLGNTVRMPGRVLRSQDELLKQLNFRARAYANASVEGYDLLESGALKSKEELSQYIENRFQQMFEYKNVPETTRPPVAGEQAGVEVGRGLDPTALGYARRNTFTSPVNETQTWADLPSMGELAQDLSRHPILKVTVLPFTTVPTNLIRAGFSWSPLAPVYRQFWDDLGQGGARAAEAKGRFLIGSAIAASAGYLMATGKVTGMVFGEDGNIDPNRSYSFVTTDEKGNKTYTPYKNLDWIGMPFGLIADAVTVINHAKEKGMTDEAAQELFMAIPLAMTRNLASKAYLQGLTETMSALFGEKLDDINMLQRLVNQKVGSLVPSIANAFSGDELKKVRTVFDGLLARTPYLNKSLEARRDYTGEVKLKPGYPFSAINPVNPYTLKDDPVHTELQRLVDSPAHNRFYGVPQKIGNVDLYLYKNAKGQSAYDRWGELMATERIPGHGTFREALTKLFNSKPYKDGHDGTADYLLGSRVTMIRREESRYRDYMLDKLKREYPQLKQDLTQDKKNRLMMQRPGPDPQVSAPDPLGALSSIMQQGR